VKKNQLLRASSIPCRLLALALASLTLASPLAFSTSAQRLKPKSARMSEERRVAHVLSRLTFGARPGDFERVRTMGVDAFIEQQLEADAIDDRAVAARLRLPTLGLAQPLLIQQYTPPKPGASPSPSPAPNSEIEKKPITLPALDNKDKTDSSMQMMGSPEPKPTVDDKPAAPKPTPPVKTPQMVVTELQRATLLRAVYSERQLFEQMVNFWENHFNIFANKDADRYLLTSFDRDTIRPFAMGRFRDLLRATAHSPAMLYYLDNWRSSVPRPYAATKDKPAGVDGGINENYARELLELHTLGVDGGYTQKDVQEVARCFTGWTIHKPNEDGLFLYRPGLHDNGEKIVLGQKIFPGGGIGDGERVLDILASHPSTARFVATKLARRFVADDPPEAVIKRAAAVFLKTDGSIRETLRAIITAPEFFSPVAYRAKLRSPFEYVVASLRALNAETDGDRPLLDIIGRMGQPLFGRVTPDGYADRAEQWLSAGAMLARFNFANALASNRVKGTKVDPATLLKTDDISGGLIALLLSDDISTQTRAAIDKTIKGDSPETTPVNGVKYVADKPKNSLSTPTAPRMTELLTLLLGSPEFQRR
jgi:uncharacterized protein (DUF1800 family)